MLESLQCLPPGREATLSEKVSGAWCGTDDGAQRGEQTIRASCERRRGGKRCGCRGGCVCSRRSLSAPIAQSGLCQLCVYGVGVYGGLALGSPDVCPCMAAVLADTRCVLVVALLLMSCLSIYVHAESGNKTIVCEAPCKQPALVHCE